MSRFVLLKNAQIINEGKIFYGHILINKPFIENIFTINLPESIPSDAEVIDCSGKYILPGIIDDQVHFREPGLTQKGDIHTESQAAVAGGITSFMEMPNTIPQTTTQKLLEEKFRIGADKSVANYSFYIGATNNNIKELIATDTASVCGVKVFMGSSTGNMLVDNINSLEKIFSQLYNLPVAVHCEEESIIKENTNKAIEKYGNNIPFSMHCEIRSHKACFASSSKAIELAKKFDTRLHLLHLSTEAETKLLSDKTLSETKRITSEVCVHHLWFTDKDYDKKAGLIKWNPAIKNQSDKDALWEALISDKIDIIATDHAPHTINEKDNPYLNCPSGAPMVQHSLQLMIENYKSGRISLEKVVEKMCHNPAICFNIKKRGYIKKGYYADIVVIDMSKGIKVNKENILYKCGWSPLENTSFSSSVIYTFVNGNKVYDNGVINNEYKGMPLEFDR